MNLGDIYIILLPKFNILAGKSFYISILHSPVVFKQLNYLKKMDQGFDEENVITLQLNQTMIRKYPVLKQILLESEDISLISKNFLLLVTISIIIAVPVAYYFMSNRLQNYVYRTNIGTLLLVLSALLTVVITFITISYKAYQASVLNPASSIKTE